MTWIKSGVLITWSENPLSSTQGGYAQVKIMLSTSMQWYDWNNGKVKIQVLSSSDENSFYLILEYRFAVLSRGMQHVLYDKDKVLKTQKENQRVVKILSEGSVEPTPVTPVWYTGQTGMLRFWGFEFYHSECLVVGNMVYSYEVLFNSQVRV